MTHQEHDIVDRVIAEKDAEIERLKGELRKVETLWFSEHYRLRDLLKRAAEMLETLGCKGPAVDELRKAAE